MAKVSPSELMPGALDPTALIVLAAVVREGGVRAGATALKLPRSTVSRQLAELEAQIGARLIARTSRRFRITDLGRALAEQAGRIEEVMRASERLIRRAATEPAGSLRVAVAPLLAETLFPEMLTAYLARYPSMRVELQIAADYVDLRRGSFDLALRQGLPAEAGDLFATRLGTSITGCYGHPRYLAARGTPHRLAELASHDCIVIGDPSWLFRDRQGETRVAVPFRIRLNDFRVGRALAAAGGGLIRLPRFYAQPLVDTGELAPVLESRWPRVPVFAVHTSVSPAPPKIRAFIELAREAAARVLE
jgi:DNA-binding transcriptional LysR family regulator